MLNVSVIFPFNVDALPRSEDAATASSSLPVALAVAAVLILTVIPVGSVPTAQVQAVCVIPTYPVNGILIVLAADVFPSEVQAIVCVSFPRTTERPPVPAEPGLPLSPLAPS